MQRDRYTAGSLQTGTGFLKHLHQRIREARKLIGLSQEQFALDLGVSRGAVAQWEMVAGTRPAMENLIAIARRSGMAFEYLATGRGERLFGEPILPGAEPAPAHPLSHQQQWLLERFDALSARQRSGLLDLLPSPAPERRPARRRV